MTFSTVKIGTHADVTASVRSHHIEGNETICRHLAHDSATKTILEITPKSDEDKIFVAISGHSHISDTGQLLLNFSVSLQELNDKTYEEYKRIYLVNNPECLVSEPKETKPDEVDGMPIKE